MPEALVDWVGIGLMAGILGRLVLPRRDPGGIVVAILVGIAGALLAAYAGRAAGVALDRAPEGYAAAVVGAVMLIALYRLLMVRRLG